MRKYNWLIEGRPQSEYTSSSFDDIVMKYEKYLYSCGKARKDVRCRVHTVARFLEAIEQRNCLSLQDLSPTDIYETFQLSSSKSAYRWAVGAFLRYAYKYGLIPQNLHMVMPSVKERKTVPSVYSPEEVERLVSAIDRTTPVGKRNYAIILMIARLGLRASDIAKMAFSSLTCKASKIRLMQKKTKASIELPLLDDVKSALFDYIDNARPNSNDSHIFLKLSGQGAFTPGNIWDIVNSAFSKSGIDCTKRATGPHALRSSLATALLSEGNDYAVIQKVLGHRNIQSVKSYAKADVEQLRQNALPVPMPSGNFASLLGEEL